jgi:uncharacterized protein (TIGR03067 family)
MHPDLDLLQGTWRIAELELEGRTMSGEMVAEGRITVDGDRFTSTGMGAEYGGTFRLDASTNPRTLDMRFDVGPEKGGTNLGIYELNGDSWRLCLAMHGSVRPVKFDSTAGDGFVVETLVRGAAAGKTRKRKQSPAAAATGTATEFEGEWPMVSGVMSGKPMDQSMVKWVKRVTTGNQTTVEAGPQTMLKVEFTSDSSRVPKTIDYVNLAGTNEGKTQLGIFEFAGDELRVCMAAPGDPRPEEFVSAPGDGRAFTVWKRP